MKRPQRVRRRKREKLRGQGNRVFRGNRCARSRCDCQRTARNGRSILGGIDIRLSARPFSLRPPRRPYQQRAVGANRINVTAKSPATRRSFKYSARAGFKRQRGAGQFSERGGAETRQRTYDASKAALGIWCVNSRLPWLQSWRDNQPRHGGRSPRCSRAIACSASLKKYGIAHNEDASEEQVRRLLAEFYATLHPDSPTHRTRRLRRLFLGPQSRCTTGHLIPVDGGLTEAFLR